LSLSPPRKERRKEMEKKVELYVGTALYKDGPQTRTKLTLDFSGLNEKDILEMATDSAVIKWQASARRAAMKKEDAIPIPESATYIVPKPGTRASGTVSDEAALVRVVGAEKAKELIAAAGGDAKKAFEKIRILLGM
jgi:hypothetical protein